MTAQERLDFLLAPVTTPTNAVITLATIREALPREAYALVLFTLQAAKTPQSNSIADVAAATEIEGVFIALNGNGISFSPQDRQDQIDQLAQAGNWPNSVRDAVKALGRVTQPRWQREGYATEPTLEQIQAELDEQRLINAKALFNERMTVSGNAATVWAQAWEDAGV